MHTYIENEVMYPRVRELLPELEDDVLESYEEHHVADVLVVELAAMKPDDERFAAKTTVLIENVRHHIEEEEQEWFPKVREGLGRKVLQEIGAEMLEARKKAPRRPVAAQRAEEDHRRRHQVSTLESAPDRSQPQATIGFGGLSIAYDERVLAPRRWTTMQSYWAAELLRAAPPGRVLELCAGAGHIGLLTMALQARDLVMVDVNPHACELARRNATANHLVASVDVRHGDLQDVIRADESFVGVIADPPWVPSARIGRFPEDPALAIDGGEDGLAVAWSCLQVMDRHLRPAVGGSSSWAPWSRPSASPTGVPSRTGSGGARDARLRPGRPGPPRCDGLTQSRRTDLCVLSHHGIRWDRWQVQSATTGRVTSCSRPSSATTTSACRTSSGPSPYCLMLTCSPHRE